MNRYARALGLESTNFANPHGLSHKNNKSTAADIGKLACIAMQDPIVRDIVNKSISFFYHSVFVRIFIFTLLILLLLFILLYLYVYL